MQMGNTDYDVYFLAGFGIIIFLLMVVPAYFIYKHKDRQSGGK